MGNRGSLPALVRNPAAPLDDLDAPLWLSELAVAFWDRHAKHLADNQLLTTETADSFALCCELWGKIRAKHESSRSYLDTVKAFTSLAKVFRLLPTEKGGRPTNRHDDKQEFDF